MAQCFYRFGCQLFFDLKHTIMSDNKNQGSGGSMDQNLNSGKDGQRGSEGLGNQSQSSDLRDNSGMERSSVADYGSSGQPLDSGDAGRGGSSGSGRTDTGGQDDMDEEGLGHSRSGAAGM